jgi:7beta-hydroxy-3-oxochol-24-oyl-CoA 4-desaturase
MKLFEPIQISNMKLKNRIVMAAMGVGTYVLANPSKQNRVFNYYAERARGGAGSLILGAVPPSYFVATRDLGQDVDVPAFIRAVSRLVEQVNRAGAKMGIQLWRNNVYPSGSPMAVEKDWVAPSARVEPDVQKMRYGLAGQSIRELTVDEIESIIDVFGEAAKGADKDIIACESCNMNCWGYAKGSDFAANPKLDPWSSNPRPLSRNQLGGEPNFIHIIGLEREPSVIPTGRLDGQKGYRFFEF